MEQERRWQTEWKNERDRDGTGRDAACASVMRFQTNGAAVSGIVTRKERVHLPSPSLPSTQLTCPLPPPIEIRRNDGSCPRECFRPRPPIARRGNGVAGRKIRRGRKSVGNRHFLREPSLHAAQGEREGVERA